MSEKGGSGGKEKLSFRLNSGNSKDKVDKAAASVGQTRGEFIEKTVVGAAKKIAEQVGRDKLEQASKKDEKK